MRSIAVALFACFASAAAAHAQSVGGTVVTRDSVPVPGAVVSLVDSVDVVTSSVLSDEFGRFELRAPRPGTWRLRVEHVGYARVASLPFTLTAGEAFDRRVHLSDATTRLPSLAVRDRARCVIRPDSGTVVATLWDEARKALNASTTSGGTTVLMDIDEDEIEFDETFRRARAATRTTTSGRVAHAFRSAPPASLRSLGYVRIVDTTTVYFGPDARALLSSEFAATHCFSLAGDDPRSIRRVGIAFAPVQRPQGLVDVAGTLWLDRETFELDRVEFRFVPVLSREHDDTSFGGHVDFARVPGGQVIARRWELRMPVFAAAQETRAAPPGASSRMIVRAPPREVVAGLIVARGAARLPGEPPLPLPGVVDPRRRDSAAPSCLADSTGASDAGWLTGTARDDRRRPVREASVRVSWQRAEVLGARMAFRTEWAEIAADPQGRFALCGVPTDRPLRVEVRVGDATRYRERLVLPAGAGRARDLTLASQDLEPAADAVGALHGRITDRDGRPVVNALVSLFNPRLRETTDADGRFAFERLPPGLYDLHTRRLGYVPVIARLEVRAGDTLDIAYPLDQSAHALGTITVEATVSSMNLQGFEMRRAAGAGSGQFIAREQLDARSTSTIIAVLQSYSRVTIEQSNVTGDVKAYGRGAGVAPGGATPDRCPLRIMIDGALLPPDSPLSVIPTLTDIAGIEIYTSAGAIPAQFSFSQAKCGLMAIWTRDGSP